VDTKLRFKEEEIKEIDWFEIEEKLKSNPKYANLLKYIQPFKDWVNKRAMVISHALDMIYFDDLSKYWILESRNYLNDIKAIYRWRFTDEIPKEIIDIIPKSILLKIKQPNYVLMINMLTVIYLPIMSGTVELLDQKTNDGNPFYCITNPEIAKI